MRRPPVAPDVVRREALHARLDAVLQLPLGLVVAPAGYGKSTLVSHWLEGCGRPGAWLSLDEGDDDLETFLRYLLAAVEQAAPKVGGETLDLLARADRASVEALARHLTHDLDGLDHLVIVLDDLHRLHDPAIFDLLDGLLEHPPGGAHLVVASRRDPPLPLARMRARHQLVEVRMGELRFDEPVAVVRAWYAKDGGALMLHPALDPELDRAWVFGVRVRLAL